MKKRVLVIGATGNLGKSVALQLKKDGYLVRVMSRNKKKAEEVFGEGYEIAEANVLDIKSLKPALHECNGVYINLSGDSIIDGVNNIIQVAKVVQTEQIGFISGSSVNKKNAWHPMIYNSYMAEEAIKKSNIPYTIFRPSFFSDMLPKFIMNGKVTLFGKQPQQWNWIYSGDLAKMVSNAFKAEKAKNKSFTIFGPQKMTMDEAILEFCKVHHPKIKKIKHIPFPIAKLMTLFIRKPEFKYFVSLYQYFEKHPQEGDPTEANAILGKPQTGVFEFTRLYKP